MLTASGAAASVDDAWARFAAGDLAGATGIARQVVQAEPDHAAAHAALGYFLLQSGQPEEAAGVLHAALAHWPGHAPLHWYLGLVAQAGGDRPGAIVSLRRACELDASLDEAAFALAWQLHDSGELDEAALWAERAYLQSDTPARALQLGWMHQCLGRIVVAADLYRDGLARAPAGGAEHAALACHLAQAVAESDHPRAGLAVIDEALRVHPRDLPLWTERAWLTRRAGDAGGARAVARQLVALDPQRAASWHVLGVIEEDLGNRQAADDAYAEAHRLDPAHRDAYVRRARLQRERGLIEGAVWLADQALHHAPDDADALDLWVQLQLDQAQTRTARTRLVPALRRGPQTAGRWRLLAAAATQRDRPRAAGRWLRRALRIDPDDIESLRALGWLAHGAGDREAAAAIVRELLARHADTAAHVQAAFVLAECGALAEAAESAQHAVATAPDDANAWRALSVVRVRQARVDDAESAAAQAVRLAPDDVDALRQLGWTLLAAHRPGEAQLAFRRALDTGRDNDVARLELAQALREAQAWDEAEVQLSAVLGKRPDWAPALLARAQLLTAAQRTAADAEAAVLLCARLLRAGDCVPDAARLLLALAAEGHAPARAALSGVAPAPLRVALRDAIAQGVHTRGAAHLQALVALAREHLGDEDAWMQCAAYYVAGLDASVSATALARQGRDMARALKLRAGLTSLRLGERPDRGVRRPRIAYIASQLHDSLLRRVLAAHDPRRVDVYLYLPRVVSGLPAHIRVLPLVVETIDESCAANGIDIVVDAGGLHPFEGQFALLRAYARRLAPLQVGWLGCWGTAGGLFDVLLCDAVTVPPSHEVLLEESVARVDGSQWAWDPPGDAPAVAPLPCGLTGAPTFGVVARPLRLNAESLDAFAAIVAAVPDSTLRFIGEVAWDAPLQRDILRRMAGRGVAPHRVAFDPMRAPQAYLAWCNGIDLVLDTFPSSGGLSLLDPLWMGVPVMTLAGDRPGARQGASMLCALGLHDWVANDTPSFVRRAVDHARAPDRLAQLRATLRDRMASSPLLDGRRIAQRVEALCEPTGYTAALAPTLSRKVAVRQHADQALRGWLAAPRRIALPVPEGDAPPDLSVVVVLFNQAGLVRRTLQALADQRGASFETLLIDNASTDDTPLLLERIDGARIVRNAHNAGFLLAANQGAALARGRHLVLLNSDAILQAGALRAARDALDADPTIGALGGRIVLTDGGLQEAGNVIFADGSSGSIGRGEDPFSSAARAARATDYVSGVFLATPLACWRRLGGFDERFAPAYYEDTDYARRVWDSGLRVVYEPAVLVEHLEWGSAVGEGPPEALLRHQQVFRERHAAWLADQPLPSALPLDGDRWRSPQDRPQRRPRVLFIDNEVPHADRGGGLPRARLMLHALAGLPVTFYPLWTTDDEWPAIARTVPPDIEVALGHGLGGLEAFLDRRRGVYDVILVSRPPNLQALAPLRARRPELFAGLRWVYDAEALFALREIGMAALQGRPMPLGRARAHVAAELALAEGASDVLVVSDRDGRHFRRAGYRTHVASHAVDLRRDAPGPQSRAGLLFVGALHPDTPNEDGVLWFLDEVMPRLRERLATPLVLDLVGHCRSQRVAARAGPGVRLLGPQPALAPHYDAARVFVAPARFAGGVPAKVIEAAAAGIPVVASALLVRQLGWRDGEQIVGARDADAFAAGIARLLQDDAAWRRQQAAAWDECARRYDAAAFAALVRAVVLGAGERAIAQAK